MDVPADSYAENSLSEGNDPFERVFRRKLLATAALNVLERHPATLR